MLCCWFGSVPVSFVAWAAAEGLCPGRQLLSVVASLLARFCSRERPAGRCIEAATLWIWLLAVSSACCPAPSDWSCAAASIPLAMSEASHTMITCILPLQWVNAHLQSNMSLACAARHLVQALKCRRQRGSSSTRLGVLTLRGPEIFSAADAWVYVTLRLQPQRQLHSGQGFCR